MTRTHILATGYCDANAYPCNPLAEPGGAWPPLGGGPHSPWLCSLPAGRVGSGRDENAYPRHTLLSITRIILIIIRIWGGAHSQCLCSLPAGRVESGTPRATPVKYWGGGPPGKPPGCCQLSLASQAVHPGCPPRLLRARSGQISLKTFEGEKKDIKHKSNVFFFHSQMSFAK